MILQPVAIILCWGEKVAKVVILSVQLLLAPPRARCEAQNAMSQHVPAYPVPLHGTRCIGARLWYGSRRMLIRVRAHVDEFGPTFFSFDGRSISGQ